MSSRYTMPRYVGAVDDRHGAQSQLADVVVEQLREPMRPEEPSPHQSEARR